jgi:hypothetical protein
MPFGYSFDGLAGGIDGFTVAMGLSRYALYIFDYGRRSAFASPWPIG